MRRPLFSRLVFAPLASALALACGADAPPPAVPPPAPVASAAPPPPVTASAAAPAPATNPFFEKSPLLYEAPPFDRIHDSDYEPAFEEGMKRQLAEIAAITSSADPPTFDNTIVAMEKSGELLTRVASVFFGVTGANTNETLQAIKQRITPKLAQHHDAIYLDPKLWARVKAIYDARDALPADAKYLVERYHQDFVRSGVNLADADKATLRALNAEESSLQSKFTDELLAATKAGAFVTTNQADLKGLSPADVSAAAEAAKARKLDGSWVLTLQNTTQQPAATSLDDRGVRERLLRASMDRAEHGDANDTRATILRIAELRAKKAKLLGYATWADYQLETQMAEKPANAFKLLKDVAPAAVAKAKTEAARMQKLVDAQKGGFKLAPWDWDYYAEQVRKADYALDESEVKPYFELDRVLQDGVFYAANQVYGISFKERHDIPVYHPDVRVFEVFDADGKSFALFYADYFKRDNKNGGAWMSTFMDQSGLLGTHPVVYNVANFTKPAPGQPALLGVDDVRTMFHEFGHALHGLFSNVKYPTLAGTSVPRDFVEFPSQFNENWAKEPTVFAHYARHYQTGAPMPAELAAKIAKTRTFNQGFALTEATGAALLDMAWHTLADGAAPKDVDAFEAKALHDAGVDYALVPPRYRSSYFLHIWGNGYSAGYYAYLWSEVLAHDAYRWFEEHGGMKRENGQRFRDMVLSQGHTQEMAPMYRAFRGADPSVEPLLEARGLKERKAGKAKPAGGAAPSKAK
jgi:peptidyl-dipeptidase Dcp